MANRRTFLKSAATASAVTITGTAGCIGNLTGDEQAYGDGNVKFLMSPTEEQSYMRKQYKPIKNRLNNYIDSADSAELKFAADYSATLTAMESGTGDVAETGPFAAALGENADKADIILQRYGYGSWTYSSVIVTREDSDIQELADLEGKKVAFADALSASGSLFPLAMLKEAGLEIPDTPGNAQGANFEPTWSSHGNAFEALMNGQVDAAGVGRFITVSDKDANDDGERDYAEGVREVGRKKGIPRAPILVSPQLSDEEKTKIQEAFTKAPDEIYYGADGEDGTDDDLWFSKVRKASTEDYQPVIDVADKLGYGQDIFKK